MCRRRLPCCAGFVVLFWASWACAAPVFFSVAVNGGVGLSNSGAQSTPQFLDTGVVENRQFVLNSVGRAIGDSSYGHVGGSAEIQSMRSDSTDWHAGSTLVYEDYVVFSGPAGATSVTTSLNLNLAYDLASTSGAVAQLIVVASVNNVDAGYRVTAANGGSPQSIPSSLVVDPAAASPFAGTATTPAVTVPLGSPVHIVLRMEAGVGAANLGSGSVDALGSLDFVLGKDLFTLPAGFTVNGETSGIVDNRFLIPEPSELVTAAIGAALLLTWAGRDCVNRSRP